MTQQLPGELTDDGLLSSLQGSELNPFDYPELWRYLYLNQIQAPGLVADCAGSNPRNWDTQAGKGQSGATLVYNGDGLAEFPAKIQIGWRGPSLPTPQEQWAEWHSFKELLKPPTEKNPNSLSIYYPNLMLLPVPIIAVVVLDVLGPVRVAPGVDEFQIKFRQYRAPAKAGTKGAGAKTDSGGGKSTQDEADVMIDNLVSELDTLL